MKKFFLFLFLHWTWIIWAQTTEYVFIYFKDKPGYASFVANPLSELSQKALDRRTRLGIALDLRDAPIENTYVEDLKTTLGLSHIKSQSKWLNGVAVEITPAQKTTILAKPYVASIESFAKRSSILGKSIKHNTSAGRKIMQKFGFEEALFSDEITPKNKFSKTLVAYNYGNANTQNAQVNITSLHLNGYTGQGISIAILDTGFPKVNQGKAFANLRDNNQIKDTYNFVGDETASVYDPIALPHPHGANVLGILAGYLNDPTNTNVGNRYFVGSAPDADYYLYTTEDAHGNGGEDYPEEEINFIRGLERADKMGVDIITASLGYYIFSDPRYDYTYNDMNGSKTFVARGANIADEKGILLTIAQGNEAANSWYYLISPADSPKVFSVGSVDASGNASLFTSYGPNANNELKPDAAAMGSNTSYTNSSYITTGTAVSSGSGTSYATPVAAGGLACLLQALPNNVSRSLIKNKMRQTASLYPASSMNLGNGILNFNLALTEIQAALSVKSTTQNKLYIFPNPVKNTLQISTSHDIIDLQLYDVMGRIIKVLTPNKTQDLSLLPKGIYFLKIICPGETFTEKIIKE